MVYTANNGIKLFVLDVDGVLTDGKIWYNESGKECKVFHTQDGLGLKRLQNAGIEIAVISGRKSAFVTKRMKELKIKNLYQGISNKLTVLKKLIKQFKINPGNVASIGDDLPDIPVMENSAISIAVNNAVPEVKDIANYCTSRPGGDGAVREACEWLLQKTAQQHESKITVV